MCIQGYWKGSVGPLPMFLLSLTINLWLELKSKETHTHTQWDITSHLVEYLLLKKKKRQVLGRMWSKGNPSALLVGVYIGTATMEVPKKIKTKTSILFSKPTSDIYPKEVNPISKSYLHVHAHCSIIHNSWDMKAI